MTRSKVFVGVLLLFPLNLMGCTVGDVTRDGDKPKEAAGTGSAGPSGAPGTGGTGGNTAPTPGTTIQSAGGATGIAQPTGGNPATFTTAQPATGGSSGAQSGLNPCVISGCSREICATEVMGSDCAWREEYGCYRGAICAVQTSGACGWTLTKEMVLCIDDALAPLRKFCGGKACGEICSTCDASGTGCAAVREYCGADGTCSASSPKCPAREPRCTQVDCISPIVCADYCGSSQTFNNGCCSCPQGTFDARSCPQPTITEGVAGIVNWSEGDFMPTVDSGRPPRIPEPLSTQIRIYSAVTESDAVPSNRHPMTHFAQINGTLVATTTSDATGLYQVTLPPGEYSVFVEDNGEWFCTTLSRHGDLCPATVAENTVSKFNINVNYMASY